MSGAVTDRPALHDALEFARRGDTLIVWKLDRLARSIRDLLNLVDTTEKAGAHIKALEDPWLDTTTPHGELILTVMGGLAEFERKLIRQRCDEGIKRAKARGTVFGRKPVLDAGERRKIAERHAAPSNNGMSLDFTHYQVVCPCGQLTKGQRRPRPQVVVCTNCRRRLFIFPSPPTSTPLLSHEAAHKPYSGPA